MKKISYIIIIIIICTCLNTKAITFGEQIINDNGGKDKIVSKTAPDYGKLYKNITYKEVNGSTSNSNMSFNNSYFTRNSDNDCIYVSGGNNYVFVTKDYSFDESIGIFSLSNLISVPVSNISEYENYYTFSTHESNVDNNPGSMGYLNEIEKIIDTRYYGETITCTDSKGNNAADNSGENVSFLYITSSSPITNYIYDSGLFNAKDESNNDIYYFRNIITNNYVKFANLTWRIVSVNNDNTIKLILNDKFDSSLTFGDSSNYKNSYAQSVLDNWYNNNLKNYDNYINDSNYCNDTSNDGTTYYSIGRFDNSSPTFNCSNENVYSLANKKNNNKIGLITMDELIRAGLHKSESNDKYYLYDSNSNYRWTMTANSNTGLYSYNDLLKTSTSNTDLAYLQPVITLKSNIAVTGSGTLEDPYIPGELIVESDSTDVKVDNTTSEVKNSSTGASIPMLVILFLSTLAITIILTIKKDKRINKI